MDKEEVLHIIKNFIDHAKEPLEQQYYDQKAVKKIEEFVDDTTPESVNDLLQKSVSLELDALVKKGKIEKVIKNGGAYYKEL